MKPLYLEFQGLYSYQERCVIPFEELARGGLFGIFGAVGSGKSTILDAITFALYGETERMNRTDSRSYNMMNLKSRSLNIDFQFSHGGEVYRFTAEAKRNSRHFEKAGTFKRAGYRREEGEWIPLFRDKESVTAEGILGMRYENFKRTVIIPQGRFQEFLSLKPTERISMLEEMFRLEKYNLSDAVNRLARRNDEALAEVTGRLSQLGEAGEADLAGLKREEAEARKRQAALSEALEQARRQLQGWERRREEYRDLLHWRERSESLLSRRAEMEENEETLSRYDWSREELRDGLTRRADLEGGLRRHRHERAELQRDLEEREGACRVLEAKQKELEPEYEALDERQEELRGLRNLAAYFARLREVSRIEAEWAGTDREYQAKSRRALQAREERRAALEERDRLSALCGSGDRLLQAREGLTRLEGGLEQFRNLQEREALLQEDAAREERLLEQAWEPWRVWAARHELGGKAELEAQWQVWEEKRGEAEARAKLSLWAGSLREGTPCPLCGALKHPAPLKTGEAGGAALEEERVRLEEGRALLEKAEEAQRRREESRGREASRAEELSRERERIAAVIEAAEADLRRAGFDPEQREALEKEIGAYSRNQQALTEADGELRRKDERCEELNIEAEAEDRRRQERYAALTAAQGALKELAGGIPGLEELQERYSGDREAAEAADKLEKRIAAISEAYSSTGAALQQADRQRQNLRGRLEGYDAAIRDEEGQLQQLLEDLQERIDRGPLKALDEAVLLLQRSAEVEELRRALAEYRRATDEAQTRLSELEAKEAAEPYDGEAHSRYEEEVAGMRREEQELNRGLGALASRIEALEAALEERKRLLQRKREREIRKENLGTLGKLFKSRGFVNYVSTLYLENLVEEANNRFRGLTREALRLELDDDNSFVIRDCLNEGRLRSIKTLSGGQTFLCAFSLALALADSLEKDRASFFFIDEGFGALDQASLEDVVGVLQGLQQEDRIIGVISHVAELKHQLDTALLVERDPEEGSRVTLSWR